MSKSFTKQKVCFDISISKARQIFMQKLMFAFQGNDLFLRLTISFYSLAKERRVPQIFGKLLLDFW